MHKSTFHMKSYDKIIHQINARNTQPKNLTENEGHIELSPPPTGKFCSK